MRKRLFLIIVLVVAVPVSLVILLPYAVKMSGIILYSVFGVPGSNEAKIMIVPVKSRFVTADDEISVRVKINSPLAVNLVAGKIAFRLDEAQGKAISTDNSIINLWIKEPAFNKDGNGLEFAGGIRSVEGGFKGEGEILKADFKPLKTGKFSLDLAEATALAHDGKGTEILGDRLGVTFYVRDPKLPSPDLNEDGTIGLSDFTRLIFHMSGRYNKAYDLNGDGKIDWGDVQMLRSY